jgi:plasmid stabilization system protein ParE
MSRFTVIWLPEAEARLTEIWIDANDRAAVATAADTIDLELAVNPLEVGTTDHEGLLRLVRLPLSVLYAVREPDQVVHIGYVHRA